MRVLFGSGEGELCDPLRGIVVTAADVLERHSVSAHRHRRGQLLYSLSGSMSISAGGSAWVINSDQAVWVPPGIEHCIIAGEHLQYRTVFIEPALCASLPVAPGPVWIDSLLRALIVESAAFGKDYRANSAESRLNAVLLDRMQQLNISSFHLPLPADRRARQVCEYLIHNPHSDLSLDVLSRQAGISSRTLARCFRNETGMTFSLWRQHLRIHRAIELLNRGATITYAALESGYTSLSSFSAMFRRITGVSPSRYFSP